ncbi:MAG TPA: hypothetical protein VHM24_08400 [Gemmatimonadaceae bacterium]|nr:hypothetical protein [Gemmatimonadaceae bacterium]
MRKPTADMMNPDMDAFDYSYFRIGSEWRTARLASSGRYGDPFEIIRMFIEQTLSERSDYSIDYVAYEVFSNTQRSRYSTRYHYSSFDDYFDRCLSAFGYRYSVYCGTYGSYYGPVVLAGPRSPAPNSPNAPREPAIRPLVPDPMLPTPPSLDPQQQVAGRFPARVSGEAAAAWRRERMLREASPRVEMKSGSTGAAEPRYIERPRAEPGVYREPMNAPVQRSEPAQRAEPMRRGEPRWEPRVMQAAPPPPPRAEPRPQPIQRIESPRSEASPTKAKDQI